MTQKATTGPARRATRQADAGGAAAGRARAAQTPTYGPEFDGADGAQAAQAGMPLPGFGPTAAVPTRLDRGQPIWIGTRRYGPY